MKNINYAIILLITVFGNSCHYNSSSRNRLEFIDNVGSVRQALVEMNVLVKKLPKNGDYQVNYELFNNELKVSDGIWREDSVAYYTNRALSNLSAQDKDKFIYLTQYLKRNHITCAYIHYGTEICLFEYKESPETNYNDSRTIVFRRDFDDPLIKEEMKILDEKDDLLLTAGKDARIYDNFSLR